MPAANRTSAVVVGMGQARTQFENTASTFTGHLDQVDDEVALLRSTWTGGTSVKFGSALEDWANDFAVVIQELRAVAEAMGGGTAVSGAREDENAVG
ncbi:WXG100 family type VII secretion target [Umezawaea endophytica]|uniref:WXG100 family type VII secretion target n=1 Tax=Umezawaea endophytica TaxID=1654476 RepID=A0A9X2ZZJ9_9PSEU|nr:WXG100 family type VII secretion target [Umezawaea endophytica]MCS7475963.1 WXG100 family type VII secretion target [Umezawaea endophytica]